MLARIIVCGWQSHQKRGFAGMARITPISTELGLGTCWIVAFDPAAARKVLGLPNDVEPIVFTPLGYADDEPGAKGRKNLLEIVNYEHW